MIDDSFSSFYVLPPVWLARYVDVEHSIVTGTYRAQLESVVYSLDTDSFSIQMLRDGEIRLRVNSLQRDLMEDRPHDEQLSRWTKYLDHLNALHVLLVTNTGRVGLASAPLMFREITLSDVARVRHGGDGASPPFGVAEFLRLGRLLPDQTRVPFHRNTVTLECLKAGATAYSTLVDVPGAVAAVAMLAKSMSEYQGASYSTSIVLGWFVIESELDRRWRERLASENRELPGGAKRINTRRMSDLTGRDFTAHSKTQVLELLHELTIEQYHAVQVARHLRNEAVHKRSEPLPTAPDAAKVLRAAADLVAEWTGIALDLPLGYSSLMI